MPVLFNKETGAAENLPDADAQTAVTSGTHEIPLVGQDGRMVSFAPQDAQAALSEGFRQLDPKELQQTLDKTKYEAPVEQLKTAAEGAASAATFGLSSGVESGLLGNAEEQLKRKEINPGVHMAGQAAGLVGSMAVPGVGAANLLERAGVAAAEQIAPRLGANAVGRIGTAATKAAVENMVFQVGDEASKMFLNDPEQSVSTAAADIGLAGLIGASIGGAGKGVSELWKLGPGAKTEKLLAAFQKRADGVPFELKDMAGIEISPNIEAALTDNPEAKKIFSTLASSDSRAGNQVQRDFTQLRADLDSASSAALGQTSEGIAELGRLSKADAGAELATKLGQTLDARIKPINEAYSAISGRYKELPIDDAIKGAISTEIANYAAANELKARSSDVAFNLANKVMEKMNEQKTAESLRLFTSDLRSSNPFTKPETWKVAKDIASIIDEARDSVIEHAVGAGGGEAAVAELRAAKDSYKGLMSTIDALDERLHVGSYHGPESFQKALAEMSPEKIAQRLNISKDTKLQQMLDSQFPEIADAVKEYERNKLAKASLDGTGTRIDANKLLKNVDKMEPEARAYILSGEAQQQLDALAQIANQIPDPKTYGNPSGTARMLDRLWKHVPASGVGMASMILGHNPATAILMGQLAHWVGKEAPDAIKLAMLKFMGSGAPVSGAGFQAAVKQAAAVLRGEAAVNKAVKSVFDTARTVIYEPSAKDRDKLKKEVDKFAAQPDLMLQDMNGDHGHYLPEHASAMGEAVARNIAYLAHIKPSTDPLGPLDPPRVPSKVEEAEYNRALDIAQKPLVVLDAVKKGQTTLSDVQHLQMLYPALYSKMQQKLMDQLMTHKSKEGAIPYKTKLGMSVFLGQPLDASMSQRSIAASFKIPTPRMSQASPARADKLSKLPDSFATPNQSRAMHRQSR